MSGKTKPKAKATSGSSKRRKSAKRSRSAPTSGATGSASRLIDQRIHELGGWRGEILARMRTLILEAEPQVTEEWKWSTPVWSHHGIVCTGETYTKAVKLTFARGASIPDPSRLFNSSLEGNTRRAIDIHEGENVDPVAFRALVKAAVARNVATQKKPQPHRGGARVKPAVSEAKSAKPRKGEKASVVLLSGGNPQIAKADGDAPVQAYIAAMPGWKRELGKHLDALITRTVPDVRKAVKWNSPLYGIEGQGFFLGLHTFTRYVKVAFFRGSSLRPVPPGPSKDKNTRYLDIHQGDELDEEQIAAWVRQAAALPGWVPGRPS